VGSIFDKAAYSFLSKVCKHNKTLKKLISAKADMTNILTYLRSENEKQAEKFYVDGGKLDKAKLATLFTLSDDSERVPEFYGYESFLKLCLAARKNKLPLTEAEKVKDSYECDYLSLNKYELKAGQPFLYYVFRRRAENENVRIVFVCLLGGMHEKDIKLRLRTI
jgi:vacuolar-type H+-ATPase subunit C/Vma6